VHPLEAHRRRVEVKVDAPEGGTKGVGKTRTALVVQRVGLAKDERRDWPRRLRDHGVVLGAAGVDRELGHGVVHQRPLEGYPWSLGAADVATKCQWLILARS
jgi:hypothetical protein